MQTLEPKAINKLPAANWHITEICNFQCNYCYATFSQMPVRSAVNNEEGCRLITLLAQAGVDKITFVGGEPTLHPHLTQWAVHAKSLGLVTAMITNGTRLIPKEGHDVLKYLDWCGLSLDSAVAATSKKMGRRIEDPVAFASKFSTIVRRAGVLPKLNTVVTRENVSENVTPIVKAIDPVRWKIFQYLPMEEERFDQSLMINSEEFASFVNRHSEICPPGVMEWEDNDRMVGSYVMIDPRGRFFDSRRDENTKIYRTYSQPIVDVGVAEALEPLNYAVEALIERGGLYEWRDRTIMPVTL